MSAHLTFGSVTRRNICQPFAPSRLAASSSSRARRLHDRDELARDKRERHEDRRQHDAGHGEDDLDVALEQPRPEPALPAEELHEDQSGHDRRHGERQIDQRREQPLAAEVEPGDRPRGGDAEDRVGRHRQRGDEERQPDCRERLGSLDRLDVRLPSVAQRLDEDERRTGRRETGKRKPAPASSAPHERAVVRSTRVGAKPPRNCLRSERAGSCRVSKQNRSSGGQEHSCIERIS